MAYENTLSDDRCGPEIRGENLGRRRLHLMMRHGLVAMLFVLTVFGTAESAPCIALPQGKTFPDTQSVIVTGRGVDSEGARKNARMAALDQAVGALIDGETRVTNEGVVEEVLSASAGFVETFEVLSEGRTQDGGHYVRAKIVVRAHQLKHRLIESKVMVARVDGESAVAKALSQAAAAEATAKFLEQNLADFPLCAMKVKLLGAIEIVDNSAATWTAGIKVEVGFDAEGWEKAAKLMRSALKNVASQTISWNANVFVPGGPSVEGEGERGAVFLNPHQSFEELRRGCDPSSTAFEEAFVVSLPTKADWRAAWESYIVPRLLMVEVARILTHAVELEITLREQSGEALQAFVIPMRMSPMPGHAVRWMVNSNGQWDLRAHPMNNHWAAVGVAGWASLERRLTTNDLFLCLTGGIGVDHAVVPPGLLLAIDHYSATQVMPIAFDIAPSELQRVKAVDLRLRTRNIPIRYYHRPRRGAERETLHRLGAEDQGRGK